jgi:hypothetical protein
MKQMDDKYNQIIDTISKNPILSKVKTDVLKKKIKKNKFLQFMMIYFLEKTHQWILSYPPIGAS